MATEATTEHDEVIATTPEGLREQALRRIRKRRDFKTHLLVYTLVNAVVWGAWAVIAVTSHSWWPWPVFVTLGWGIGLAMNAWDVYVRRPITAEELEHEMNQLRGTDERHDSRSSAFTTVTRTR